MTVDLWGSHDRMIYPPRPILYLWDTGCDVSNHTYIGGSIGMDSGEGMERAFDP